MSDDTLFAGSDEELPAEMDIGAGESAPDGTTDEASEGKAEPKGKEKALRDTEAALKESKAEYTRMTQQLAEMRGQLKTLTELQSQIQQQKQEPAKDWMEELNSDKVVEDPLAAMKFMRDQMRREIASVLSDRDAFLLSKVSKPSLDPELQSRVDELKNDPDFADLPAEKLAAIAKRMGTPKKAVMQPRGSVSGTGRTAPAGVKKDGELSDMEKAYLIASGMMKTSKRDDTLE